MRTLRRRALAALLAGALVAACTGSSDDAQDLGAPADPTPSDPADVSPPSDLDFTASTVDGGQLDASSLEGRDVVLWFWAPW